MDLRLLESCSSSRDCRSRYTQRMWIVKSLLNLAQGKPLRHLLPRCACQGWAGSQVVSSNEGQGQHETSISFASSQWFFVSTSIGRRYLTAGTITTLVYVRLDSDFNWITIDQYFHRCVALSSECHQQAQKSPINFAADQSCRDQYFSSCTCKMAMPLPHKHTGEANPRGLIMLNHD